MTGFQTQFGFNPRVFGKIHADQAFVERLTASDGTEVYVLENTNEGGDVSLIAGDTTESEDGGSILVYSGDVSASSTGDAGDIQLVAGTVSSAAGDGGSVTISSSAGGGTSGNDGNVNLVATTGGGGTTGRIRLTANDVTSLWPTNTPTLNQFLAVTGVSGSLATLGYSDVVFPNDFETETVNATDTTDSTSTSTGAITTAGGIGAAKNITSLTNTTTGTTNATSTTTGTIITAGGIGCAQTIYANSVVHTSDRRFKEQIQELDTYDCVKAVTQLRPSSFRFKSEPERVRLGLIAQEVKEVIPELVVGTEEDEMMAINYGELGAVLAGAIKDLTAKVEALEDELKEMKRVASNGG